MAYRPRVVDEELAARLSSTGAVVIEGPKACGKTSTARQVAQSEVLLDVDESARQAASIDPSLVLEGAVPRLIDEWQLEPALWNHIRRTIDKRAEPGQFILAGSAVPADSITRHTGAGRITRLRMRPMSLFESGYSTGEWALSNLLEGQVVKCPDPGLTLGDLTERVAVGGWPGLIRHSVPNAVQANRDYLEEIRRVDIRRVDETRRDVDKVGKLLRSMARNVSTYATVTTLAADTQGADGALDDDTVRSYLSALEQLMIVEDQPAWAPHLRSKSILRSMSKRHLVDPSLAVAALRATPDRLVKDLRLLGQLFESLVLRDLRVYAQANDARVYQYRDNTGLEVDAVVETASGTWIAVEVKLGPGQVDDGAKTLMRFRERVDTAKSGEPAALAVIVSAGFAYQREDGVDVIPIGVLGP